MAALAQPRRRARGAALVPLMVAVMLALAACGPEGARERGDGATSGADPGNWDRDRDIELQGEVQQDDRIYFDTPQRPPREST